MYIVIVPCARFNNVLDPVQGINVCLQQYLLRMRLIEKMYGPKLGYKILQQITWTAKCLHRYMHRVLVFHFAQCSREDENVRPGKGGEWAR
jgi:hypothetical protein